MNPVPFFLYLFLAFLVSGCTSVLPVQHATSQQSTPHSGGSTLAFDPTSRVLASAGWEGKVYIWRVADGKPSHGWRAHDGNVNGVAIRETSYSVVTVGRDGVLAEWTYAGELLHKVSTGSPITHMAMDEPNGRVVTGHKNGHVQVWALDGFRLLGSKDVHIGAVRSVAIHAPSVSIASSGRDGEVAIWQADDELRYMGGMHGDIWTLAFSPDGKWLMGGSWFRLARWNVNDGTFASLPTKHHGIIKSIQYTPDGTQLASISRQTDSSIYFLDPASGSLIKQYGKHELCGGYLALSPDGRYMATTGDDADLRIWDLQK